MTGWALNTMTSMSTLRVKCMVVLDELQVQVGRMNAFKVQMIVKTLGFSVGALNPRGIVHLVEVSYSPKITPTHFR